MGCVYRGMEIEVNVMRLVQTSPSPTLLLTQLVTFPQRTPDTRKTAMKDSLMYQCNRPLHRPHRASEFTIFDRGGVITTNKIITQSHPIHGATCNEIFPSSTFYAHVMRRATLEIELDTTNCRTVKGIPQLHWYNQGSSSQLSSPHHLALARVLSLGSSR